MAGLEKIDRDLRNVYAAAGKPEHWKLIRQDVAHQETPGMRAAIRDWLVTYL